MFRRTAATASAAVALTAAGLFAAAPLAAADPVTTDDDITGISLLDDLTVLPVQTCGLDASIPILSDLLEPGDAAPDASCAIVDDAEDD
ncbi:hypothetical protein [Actinomycetospora straminea]|uniref:Small secreted domain DUF320 n=1 Tax=Actinomycetospora straminea TaxID=663607 RepID=A0ABP9EEK0_9PSEU|nr:hypothetical protein [Actinomycetospora straminea]MDD7934538.1 hypothetical protein [Actinomycetospora straminea]